MDSSDSLLPAPDVDPYRAVGLMHAGVHADVWHGKGPWDVDVAVKVARDAGRAPRLAHEARALARVDHPTVVRLMDVASDTSWLVLEMIRGEPIDEWARAHSIDDLIRTTMKLVDGLRHMHEHGVVHGDIKPSNILVDELGHPTLLDLGVATLEGDPDPPFRGTLGFSAPELLRGDRPTPASDLYSLGATLYLCLTGKTPFTPDDPAALTYVPLVSLPSPPSTWAPQVPLLLEQAVMALLARSPDRRPSKLQKVKSALQMVPTSRSSQPILGMHATRDALRRAVVAAADGTPQVVVLYGPPGCGRATLLGEAVEAARREGLLYQRDVSPRVALSALTGQQRPSVCRFDAAEPGARALARQVLEEGLKAVVFLRSDRPLPDLVDLGARHLTPPLLGQGDAITLITSIGGHPERARAWWVASRGLPAGVVARFRAWRRRKRDEPLDLGPGLEAPRRILSALQGVDEALLPDLARHLELEEHTLLDHCEVLFGEGLVEPTGGGTGLRVTEAGRPPAPEEPR